MGARRSLRHLGSSYWPVAVAGLGLLAWQARVWLWYPWNRPFPYAEYAAWLIAALLLVGDGMLRLLNGLRTRCSARVYRIGTRLVLAVAGLGALCAVGAYVWAEIVVGASLSRLTPAPRCSQALMDATVAMEDGHFYRHHGFDWVAVHRALRCNVQAGKVIQGGSTITQQLAKALYLGPERTVRRKVLEASLTMALERRLSKRRILDLYVMAADYGMGARGIDSAARVYFRKRPDELDLAESAVLVGLVPSPPQRFLTTERMNEGRRRAVARLGYYFPNRYAPAALNDAATRPIEGWVRPYVAAQERGATADLPAVVGGVSFCLYSDPARPRPLRHLHPDFARRIRAFVRDARSQLGLRRIVHLGAYVDRFERGSSTTLSSHALGCALDIKGFAFHDGRVIEARPSTDRLAGQKLDQARRLLQRHFPRVLWWGNEPVRHHDHFHVELSADEADIRAIFERKNDLWQGASPCPKPSPLP